MSFLNNLEHLSNDANDQLENRWTGTFREFLQLFETHEYENMGVLAHARILNMITDSGVIESDHFGMTRKKYKFFENKLYGIEDSIDQIMGYVYAAAQRTETSRRLLLLYGPPSSGKSEIVNLLKRGLEDYTRTKQGSIFAIRGSKMHENPFLLIPEVARKEFSKTYGLQIEGSLSPMSRWRLEHDYDGKFMDFPIEQIFLSESKRIGIGTWLPSDPKGQDISELVGSIDLSKIQEVGDESDPRAYNFDGEINVANRGIMEYIEGLKSDERFLRSNLTATQEKTIKAPRFGLVYVDCVVIIHTNEAEFRSFMSERKYEAYHDRMVIVRVPYNLGISDEVKIYKKLLSNSDALKNMHISPHTIESAAMFAILTRLEPTEKDDLTIVKKMKLYDGQHVKGHKTEQVFDIKKRAREGMTGASPRFVIDQICAAIEIARNENRDFVTPLDVLRQLNKGIRTRDNFDADQKNKYEEYVDIARTEWNDMLRNDIQKAFFLSFEDEARNLCNNYIDMIESACSGESPRDPITNEEKELDEKLMDEIEDHIDISKSGKEDFRNEILRAVGSAARKNKQFDYTQHAHLREAIQSQLFQERQGTIRLTVSSRNPDPEALRRLNEVIDRMEEQQGYSPASANELLKYATAHLFDK